MKDFKVSLSENSLGSNLELMAFKLIENLDSKSVFLKNDDMEII